MHPRTESYSGELLSRLLEQAGDPIGKIREGDLNGAQLGRGGTDGDLDFLVFVLFQAIAILKGEIAPVFLEDRHPMKGPLHQRFFIGINRPVNLVRSAD
jgi:hypothetical protein